jgi:hypothetical protein
MFVHNKRIITPTFLDCEGIHLAAVTKFKLLGFIIDQKLDFQSHVGLNPIYVEHCFIK